jgi:hypothetical protein
MGKDDLKTITKSKDKKMIKLITRIWPNFRPIPEMEMKIEQIENNSKEIMTSILYTLAAAAPCQHSCVNNLKRCYYDITI